MVRTIRKWIFALTTVFVFSYFTFLLAHMPIKQKNIEEDIACRRPLGWRKKPFSAPTVSNMKDWAYLKVIKCPIFSIQGYPAKRDAISLKCDGEHSRIVSRTTEKSSDIFQIPFGNKCLKHVIDRCCMGNRLVPNVVHYVWYNKTRMDFFHFLSFMSAVKFVEPCMIVLHGPYLPYGSYWDYFVRVFPNIIHMKRNHSTSIGDNKLAYPEHGSDVMRIEALRAYGGMYLDWDEVILRSVDTFRDYEMTMGIETVNFEQMGSQFVIAKPMAAFLTLWYRSYFEDYRTKWTYNALVVPYKLARQLPDIIHVEGNAFCRPDWFGRHLIFKFNYDWSDNYAMHLYSRWYNNIISEKTIGLTNSTLGAIARHILFGNKELCV